jgi:hypothetical protein
MDTILNLPSLNLIGHTSERARRPAVLARSHVAAAVLIFLGAGMATRVLAQRDHGERDLPVFRAEVAQSIAQQGNEAVRQIELDARRAALSARPAPLSEIAVADARTVALSTPANSAAGAQSAD